MAQPQTFNYDIADASLTGFASNVTGASWTLTANVASDGLAHQVSIRNDSATNWAGITILLVGTDPDGNTLSEAVTGPGSSATVESAGYFKTLTSATPSATINADTMDIGWVDELSSQTIVMNYLVEDTFAINADVTGTINFTIQETFDDILYGSLTRPSQQAQWITVAASQTADGTWQATGGATAVRMIVNTYSSGAEIQLNVNPTIISEGGGGTGVTEDVNLAEVGGAAIALGQTTMAASLPVAIASNQSAIPVLGSVAHDAADSGAPVKIGGYASSTAPANVTAADRVNAWFLLNGSQAETLFSSAGSEIIFTSATIATGQVAPTSTAATLIAARVGRKSVTFYNSGAVNVWIGPATVTSANGLLLIPGASYTSYSEALWQAITASATGAIGYAEEY